MDGQQRLTTIMILLKSIADLFKEEGNDSSLRMTTQIENSFLYTEKNRAEQKICLELGKFR